MKSTRRIKELTLCPPFKELILIKILEFLNSFVYHVRMGSWSRLFIALLVFLSR